MSSDKSPRVGLGVVTYNRPAYLERCLAGIAKHLKPDVVWIHDDHSCARYGNPPFNYHYAAKNKGVGVSKNWLLKKLLSENCDYIFLIEDDIVPISPRAISGYIKASKASGYAHYNFAHHGPANPKPIKIDGLNAYYPNFVGAFSMYTAPSLRDAGLIDENFHNAYEHVEHTYRLSRKGYTTWPIALDALGSEKWLREIPGSIDNSSIRGGEDWQKNIDEAKAYWRTKEDCPLGA